MPYWVIKCMPEEMIRRILKMINFLVIIGSSGRFGNWPFN